MEQEVGRSSDKVERVARLKAALTCNGRGIGNDQWTTVQAGDLRAAIAACEAEAGERERVLRSALGTARKALDRNYVFNVSLESILAMIDAVLNTTAGEGQP